MGGGEEGERMGGEARKDIENTSARYFLAGQVSLFSEKSTKCIL